MKPFVLVLLVAASVSSAPVTLNLYGENELAVSQSLVDQAFSRLDVGDVGINVITAHEIIKDLERSGAPGSRALAIAQSIGVLSGLASGTPGDACAAANLIDTYAEAVASGNYGRVRPALSNFINGLSGSLDNIANLGSNPQLVRFATGSSGGCRGGGRSYNFEAAWDAILSNATPANFDLLNEQYCTAKRLYHGLSSRSNNVAALVTALALPPVVQIFDNAIGSASSFVSAVGSGANAAASASAVRGALAQAAANVRF